MRTTQMYWETHSEERLGLSGGASGLIPVTPRHGWNAVLL